MACHEDPSRRYQTAGAFADELDRWLAGRPILARPDSLGYRTRKFLQRHRWVAPAATVGVVLIAGWGATVMRQNTALERERTIAQEEAARAEEVLAFVLGLFNTASPVMLPSDGQWRELTVVDAMQQGIPDIRARFADRPELQAELLGTIAEVLWSLEVQGVAEPLAGEAERLLAQATGDSSAARTFALARLAHILSGTALADSATQLTEQVLALYRQDPLMHRRAAVTALAARGRMAYRRGDFSASARAYRDADAVIAEDSLFDPEATLTIINGRLNSYLSLDSLGPAEEQARRAVALSRLRSGDQSVSHAIGLVNLARVLSNRGEDAEAIELYARGTPPIAQAYGPDHSTTISVRTNHATALRGAGRSQDAVAIMRELVAQDTVRPLDALDAGAADRLQNLGVFLVDVGDTADGTRRLRDAAAIYARETPTSPRRVFPNLTLSAIALAQANWRTAERDARTALAALETALPPGHYVTEVARCRVGRALLGRGAVEAARSPLRTAGQRLAARAPETPYRPECIAAWADLEHRLGAVTRADSIMRLLD
jgi:tetratricopeptide (TPR) repeat protein